MNVVPDVIFKIKFALGQNEGSPVPLIVTFAPFVEIEEGVALPNDAVTWSKKPFVSPMGSILALTLYSPLSTVGKVKLIEVEV